MVGENPTALSPYGILALCAVNGLSIYRVLTKGEMQPRRHEMLAWWPNMKLQAILLQIFIMINEGVQNLKTNMAG